MGVAAAAPSTEPALGRDPQAVARLARAENFPVALRVLPRAIRRDLHAVYALARLIDDVGDDATRPPGERLTDLGQIEAALHALAADRPVAVAAVAALGPLQQAGHDVVPPFLDLVAANKLDQSVRRYATYDDLRAYCALSANPVGRLVLSVFGVGDDARVRGWSDDVCTALQVLEHCQDVAEDKRDNDRVYLPQDELTRFAVRDADLDATQTHPRMRALVAFEVDRAAELLGSGPHLVRSLRGYARMAIAGYVAGGLATVDALHRCDFDVLAQTPRPAARDVMRHFLRLVVSR